MNLDSVCRPTDGGQAARRRRAGLQGFKASQHHHWRIGAHSTYSIRFCRPADGSASAAGRRVPKSFCALTYSQCVCRPADGNDSIWQLGAGAPGFQGLRELSVAGGALDDAALADGIARLTSLRRLELKDHRWGLWHFGHPGHETIYTCPPAKKRVRGPQVK